MKQETKNTLILVGVTTLIIILYFILVNKDEGVFDPKETNFAITEDSIRKITIVQKIKGEKDKKVVLENKGNKWFVNGKLANKFRVEELLHTVKTIKVRERPTPQAEETFLKFLKDAHLLVTIETPKETKEYYVGPTTADGNGTIAMLKGAEHPYVVHIPGFAGTIAPRFSPNESDWVDLRIHPQDSIKELLIISDNDTLFYIKVDKDIVRKYVNKNRFSKLPDVLELLNKGIYAERKIIKERHKVLEEIRKGSPVFIMELSDGQEEVQIKFYNNEYSREHLYALVGKDSTLYLVQKFILLPLLGSKNLGI